MLVSFRVKNYLSFRDEVLFDLRAVESDKTLSQNTFSAPFKKSQITLLKSAVIYGPNASGKTNLLYVLKTFRTFVCSGMKTQKKGTPFLPFLLNKEASTSPSEMEVYILSDKTLYRYGFAATRQYIAKEWLYITTLGKERPIYERTRQESGEYTYEYGNSGKSFAKFVSKKGLRENVLLLTVANFFENEEAQSLFKEIENMYFPSDNVTISEKDLPIISMFLKYTDTGLERVDMRRPNVDALRKVAEAKPEAFLKDHRGAPQNISPQHIAILQELISRTASNIENTRKENVFIYKNDEDEDIILEERLQSNGTVHLLHICNSIARAYRKGGVLFFDEIEESLHPMVAHALIDMIHALPGCRLQVIATTHSIPLLNSDLFRRDQVWIVQKEADGNSQLSSISDYTGVRNTAKLGKQYLDDKFGGLPILDPRLRADLVAQFSTMCLSED